MQIRKPLQLKALDELLHGHRYLLCVDLEATCDSAPEGLSPEDAAAYPLAVTHGEMETIEIGAVVVDLHNACRVVGELSRFVRPVLHPELTDFCKQLTTITQADVDGAASYSEVCQAIDDFLSPYRAEGLLWCSWGDYDRKQLLADAIRAGCAPMLEPSTHFNMKKWYAKIFACKAIGLKPATNALGLDWIGTYHRGIDDARNLSGIAWAIFHAPELTDPPGAESAEVSLARFTHAQHTKALAQKQSGGGDRSEVQQIKREVEEARLELERLKTQAADSFVAFARRYQHKVWLSEQTHGAHHGTH